MGYRPGSIFHTLGFRLLVPLCITVGVVVSFYAAFSFDSTRLRFQQLVREQVKRISTLIQRATHDGMLLNRLDEVQNTIQRLAETPDLAAIRVYDKEGDIVMSARRGEIGARISLETEPCLSCHSAGAPMSMARLEEIHLPLFAGGGGAMRHLTVIENAPGCVASACHQPVAEKPVLGVLDVEMSMAPIEATLRATQRQLVWATAVLLPVLGLVTWVFLRRLVQVPVGQIFGATQRIAAGDLTTRIDVRGRHELARLGGAFNRMAEDLQTAQQELAGWSRTLEAKVLQKTEEVRRAQGQVLHMEKMASLGKLSATVAHELNNPLSGILTYARLIGRELEHQPIEPALRSELGRYLSVIQKECARCGDIVKNLLLFARQRGAAMAPCDVNEIVDRALMLVRHHLEISSVQVRRRPLAGDAQIVADGAQLQQCLLALFVNAVEAMQEQGHEGGELSVALAGDAAGVTIDVGDTGVGINPDVLPQIFEPFFSTKQEASGVGLGLAVVYGIVQRHGGSIDVESTPGRGTVFHLRLPRKPSAAEGI